MRPGSFFASRRANTLTGWLCNLCTLTPYGNWARQHRLHHGNWNNLDRSDSGSDIYSSCLTVHAYLAMTGRQRMMYRLARHPLVANLVLPPLAFLLLYRFPSDTPRDWHRERRSVYATNLALTGLFAKLVLLLGWREVLLVHVLVVAVASILASGCSRCSTASPAPAGQAAEAGAMSMPHSTVRPGSTCPAHSAG